MSKTKLAINGGTPTRATPWPAPFPGALAIAEEEEEAVLAVIRSQNLFRYYGGKGASLHKVKDFEQAFARYTGARYALGVTSGTAALMTALAAAGVGPGDEVIIPAYTWIATATAVVWNMAIPVIAEVDATLTLDPEDVAAKITPRTRAIIPVHMRGAACRMDAIMELAKSKDLLVIEDTAQANGATLRGQRLGTFGDLGAFSLQYHKMITTGEGGAVISSDPDLFRRAQAYHDGGGIWRKGEPEGIGDFQLFTGVNFRMSEITGALAEVQLAKLDGLIARQRAAKRRITEGTVSIGKEKGFAPRPSNDLEGDVGVCLIYQMPDAGSAQSVASALRAENVSAGTMFQPDVEDWHVYYHWGPIMEKRTANRLGCPWTCPYYEGEAIYDRDSCPTSLDLLSRSLHIDISPSLSDQDADSAVEAIIKVTSELM